MEYSYTETSLIQSLPTYFIAIIPIIFFRGLRSISSFISILIYVFAYIPIIQGIHLKFGVNSGYNIFLIQIILCFFISLYFIADRIVLPKGFRFVVHKKVPYSFFLVITGLLTIYLIFIYRNNMHLVNLSEIYQLRSDNYDITSSGLNGYILSWLSMVFYPIIFVISLINKSYFKVAIISFCYVLLFMMTGAKLNVFMPIIIFCFSIFFKWESKSQLGVFPIMITAITSLSILLFMLNSKIIFIIKSIFFTRTLAVSGKQFSIYLSFFSENPVTNYTHISFIRKLTNAYPYGDVSLGYVVTDGLANANAVFWVTDGIAALMIPGLIIISIVFFVYLLIINSLSKKLNNFFIFLIFIPSSMALLNASFFTYLLTNGVFIIIFILFFVKLPMSVNK